MAISKAKLDAAESNGDNRSKKKIDAAGRVDEHEDDDEDDDDEEEEEEEEEEAMAEEEEEEEDDNGVSLTKKVMYKRRCVWRQKGRREKSHKSQRRVQGSSRKGFHGS